MRLAVILFLVMSGLNSFSQQKKKDIKPNGDYVEGNKYDKRVYHNKTINIDSSKTYNYYNVAPDEIKKGKGMPKKTGPNHISVTKSILNGTWVGKLTQLDRSPGFTMLIEIQVIQDKITGTAQINDERNQHVFAKFSISGDYNNDSITFSDLNLMDLFGTRTWCMKEYTGELTMEGNEIAFSGSWNNDSYKIYNWGKIQTNPTKCSGGNFTLKKIN